MKLKFKVVSISNSINILINMYTTTLVEMGPIQRGKSKLVHSSLLLLDTSAFFGSTMEK